MNGAVLAGPRTLGSWCGLGGGAGPATISMVGTGGGVKVQQPAHIRCSALSSNTKLLCNQYSANIMMYLYRLWNMEAFSRTISTQDRTQNSGELVHITFRPYTHLVLVN